MCKLFLSQSLNLVEGKSGYVFDKRLQVSCYLILWLFGFFFFFFFFSFWPAHCCCAEMLLLLAVVVAIALAQSSQRQVFLCPGFFSVSFLAFLFADSSFCVSQVQTQNKWCTVLRAQSMCGDSAKAVPLVVEKCYDNEVVIRDSSTSKDRTFPSFKVYNTTVESREFYGMDFFTGFGCRNNVSSVGFGIGEFFMLSC